MPPKAAPKRKATANDGGGSPKKSAVDTRNAGSTSLDQSAEDEPNLAILPTDILYRIYSSLAPPDRYNLRLTCTRLCDVEKCAPGKRTVSECAHLAVRNTVEFEVHGGQARTSRRRLKLDDAPTMSFIECVMHDEVVCYMHADNVEGTCCVEQSGPHVRHTFGDTFGSRSRSVGRYWKVSLEGAPAFFRALARTMKARMVCMEVDLTDRRHDAWLEQMRGLNCTSVAITHGKAKSVVDWTAKMENGEELAVLPPHIFDSLPYFIHATKLLLRGVYVQEGQYEDFYKNIKASSLKHLSLIYGPEKHATAQFNAFLDEAFPLWDAPSPFAPFARARECWSFGYRRDGDWTVETRGRKLSLTRRLVISRR